MERYVEVDIQYKYHPDEVTELMSEPDPELIIPPPAELELYNIDDDPLEQNNMASSEPERASRMLGALETWFEGGGGGKAADSARRLYTGDRGRMKVLQH